MMIRAKKCEYCLSHDLVDASPFLDSQRGHSPARLDRDTSDESGGVRKGMRKIAGLFSCQCSSQADAALFSPDGTQKKVSLCARGSLISLSRWCSGRGLVTNCSRSAGNPKAAAKVGVVLIRENF